MRVPRVWQILICQCLTLTTPFEGPNPKATLDNVLHDRRVSGPSLDVDEADAGASEISPSAARFIDALLQPDPAERLGGPLRGADVLRTQPFFWGFDFVAIEKRQMTPPHAKICRERAVATISHPACRLPPLPRVPQLSKHRQSDDDGADDGDDGRHEGGSGDAVAGGGEAASVPPRPSRVAPPVATAPAPSTARATALAPPAASVAARAPSLAQPDTYLGEEEDMLDYL